MAARTRAQNAARLAALNRNLARLGAVPVVDDEGAEALTDDQLDEAVRLTGDRVLEMGRALRGMS